MRLKFIIFILLTVTEISFAQLVTSLPQYPTENDSIVVFLDTSQPGAEELVNYTGTIYVHAGVNTNFGNWQHVIESWGNNTTQPALTKDSTNHYKLTIGYPRQFFNVTNSSEHISSFAFVFRTADGNSQTRPDIFYTVYQPGYTLALNSPSVSNTYGDPQRSPLFVGSTDTVNISVTAVAIGTKNSLIKLFVNGTQKTQTTTDSLAYTLLAASDLSAGANEIVIAGNDTSTATDTLKFSVMVNPAITNASLPNETELGINYNPPTQVTLALLAPQKSFVYVIGDFNDWKVDQNYFMKRDSARADSVVWWLTITGLNQGQEYAFQYLVDGNLRIADPFAHKVLDSFNDPFISSAIYPGLKPYPSGKTSEIVSVLQTNQPQYNWAVTNFDKPDKSNLVIYELLVRDFVSTHWFKTVMDTLDYLKNLGVNAIEFMPVMEFEGNESWGYNQSFHLALDKYYGTRDAFKTLVDSAHSKGIAVLLDVVLNHAFGQNSLVRMYFAGNGSGQILTTTGNPYFNTISPNNAFHWGADFNHTKPATEYYVDRVTSYWINEFHIDGFRFDFSKGFTNFQSNDGGAYDASRIAILERMASKIWAIDSTSILILEHFAANNEEQELSQFGFLSWGNMNSKYNEATMGYHQSGKSNFADAYYVNRGWPKPSLVTYMESHDEERLMFKNLQYGNSSPYYNVKILSNGLSRMSLASAFFFAIPGPKMIWQFGELGYDYSIDYNGRLGNKPIKWDYFNIPERQKLYRTMAAIIKLRNTYPVFQTTATLNVSDSLKSIKFSDSSMKVNIIGNFSVYQASIDPAFQQAGTWYDYFTGDSITVANVDSTISLSPSQFNIYTTVRLPKPNIDIVTAVDDQKSKIVVKNYRLEQNYPNPFNPSTIIRYQIPESGLVTVKIYDLLGREVKTLVNEFMQGGIYNVSFNAANLASGIYFYQIKAGNFISTKKMILLR